MVRGESQSSTSSIIVSNVWNVKFVITLKRNGLEPTVTISTSALKDKTFVVGRNKDDFKFYLKARPKPNRTMRVLIIKKDFYKVP